MTYLELINNFWCVYRICRMTPPCVLLYFHLLQQCNLRRWVSPFELATAQIEHELGLTRVTINKCREALQRSGLIRYEAGRGLNPPRYEIVALRMPGKAPPDAPAVSPPRAPEAPAAFDEDEVDILAEFFAPERKASVDALCAAWHTDSATLRKYAAEIVAEWKSLPQRRKHESAADLFKHLQNTMRVKIRHDRNHSNTATPIISARPGVIDLPDGPQDWHSSF